MSEAARTALVVVVVLIALDTAHAIGKHEGMRQATWMLKAYSAGLEGRAPPAQTR